MNDLDTETERLNEALRDAEDALVAHHPGVCADVTMTSGCVLRFAKDGAQWGLFVVDPSGAVWPLLKAARKQRVAAVDSLNDMMSALGEARMAHTLLVRAAADKAARFAEILRLATTSAPPVKP